MKAYNAGLLTNVTGTYDKTKTTIAGRVFSKTVNSQTVLGPPLTSFIDVQTIAGIAPLDSYYNSTTQRLFFLGAFSVGTVPVVLFNFNASTGVYSYVGKILVALSNAAATTQTLRGFVVNDSATNWNVEISTVGSVVINGGTYTAANVVLADFTPGGTTIFAASGSGQKAVYFMQDPSAVGLNHVATTSGGLAYPFSSADASINTKIYQQNGTAATLTIYSWDIGTAPTIAGAVTNGISAQITPYAATSPAAYFTMGASNNGYSNTAPTAALFEAVVLQNGTGNVPTAFTPWTSGTLQVAASNVYFIRDLQLVAGNWYFNLATTAIGAAVTPTSSTSLFTMMRAFGISTNTFNFKTNTITPSLTGTLLLTNSFQSTNPTSVPANPALNGTDCFAFGTSSSLYMGKISDLGSGSVNWPSLTNSNLLGTGIDIVAPVATFTAYSKTLDRFVYVTNTSTFVAKPLQNNTISQIFGGLSDAWLEGQAMPSVPASLAAVSALDLKNGWLFASGSTAGQRGCVAMDLRSDATYGYSYIISPQLSVPVGTVLRYIQTLEQLFDFTDSLQFQIRSAATASDTIFDSASGGWINIATAIDNNLTIQPFYQIRLNFYVATYFANSPAQVNDISMVFQLLTELSDYWAGDNDNTTVGTNTPSYTAFVLSQAYPSAVPTLFIRAYDQSGSLLFSGDSVTNASLFQYSTDGGISWTNLGTIPNTVGTRVRFNVASPPGQLAYVTIRES